jgi:hypothetical protein
MGPLGEARHRCVDNIKMDLGEIGWGGLCWIGVGQYIDKCRAVVNAVMNIQDP